MVFAGIKVPDTTLVRNAMELARGLLEPFLFNRVMRSWLFGVVLSEGAEHAPDAELLAVAAVLHDLGLTDRYTGANRFEVDGANAARVFLSDQGISAHQMQLVWDAIALHTTPTLALHKEPEVVMVHSGIAVDVLGVGLDRVPQDKQRAILSEFPRLAFKTQFKGRLCNVVRQKPMTTVHRPDKGLCLAPAWRAEVLKTLLGSFPASSAFRCSMIFRPKRPKPSRFGLCLSIMAKWPCRAFYSYRSAPLEIHL
jgi:hypothetical protein